jgi:hypothetical protein
LGNWLTSDSILNYTGSATLEAVMNQSEWRMTGVYSFEFYWHERFYIQVSEELRAYVYPWLAGFKASTDKAWGCHTSYCCICSCLAYTGENNCVLKRNVKECGSLVDPIDTHMD